jgi:hypothetical protein
MTTRSRLGTLLLATALVVGPASVEAQTLDEAKTLYASAAYTEALAALRQLPDEAVTQEVRRYRALCLLALGQRTDAEREVVAVVQADPLYMPSGDEVTPRMVTIFRDVRQRQLPAIIQRDFVEATRIFVDDSGPKARHAFERLLQLLSDPLVSERSELANLRLVTARFVDRLRETPALTLADGPPATDEAAPTP